MRILLTNDDGVDASGFAALERIARSLSDDVWMVAPQTDQSGVAHSLTLHDPIRLRQIDDRRFAVRGTPTDCVIMALREVMPEAPDLILSGVNRGSNVADDVTYSGTIAAAIEGTLMGVKSIALSQALVKGGGHEPNYETAEAHGPDLIRKLLKFDTPSGTLLNVNFPACPASAVRGVEVTSQGEREPGALSVEKRMDGRGNPYFWLAFRGKDIVSEDRTDLSALREDTVSVTPLRLDLTAHNLLEGLRTYLD